MFNKVKNTLTINIIGFWSILTGILITYIGLGLTLAGVLIFILHCVSPPASFHSTSDLITKDYYLFSPILVLLLGIISVLSGWHYRKRKYWALKILGGIHWLELIVVLGLGIYWVMITFPPGILAARPYFTDLIALIAPFIGLSFCLLISGILFICIIHFHSRKTKDLFQKAEI